MLNKDTQRWMTLLEVWRMLGIPDWGWCPWWHYGWSTNVLRELCLKFGWNPISLKASKNPVKDRWHFKNSGWSWWWFWHSWLGLMSLMTLWIVCKYPEEALFKIWLNSVEFKDIKNTLKDGWLCWRFGGCWKFLTGNGVIDHDWDLSLKVLGGSV